MGDSSLLILTQHKIFNMRHIEAVVNFYLLIIFNRDAK